MSDDEAPPVGRPSGDECCGTCRYWGGDRSIPGCRECLATPPTQVTWVQVPEVGNPVPFGRWLYTARLNWCGRYTPATLPGTDRGGCGPEVSLALLHEEVAAARREHAEILARLAMVASKAADGGLGR